MSAPTPEQVQAEIEELRRLVDKVRPRSFFGDDNRACIQAQIKVLSEPIRTVEGCEELYEGYVLDGALSARDWMAGELSDEEETPALSWQCLVQ
ncbi:MAG: hypothetical protein KF796_19180 [Ramlibacter sp.]|nr:hypothetical protein [Ramlibacter sp.]